jgi:hypothetical protein
VVEVQVVFSKFFYEGDFFMPAIMEPEVQKPRPKPTQQKPAAPPRYTGFDGQFIDGSWRPGRQGSKRKDLDPYSGETVTEIALASQSDLNEALRICGESAEKLGGRTSV